MQEYDSKCLKMYLIILKVFTIFFKFLAPISEVNEGESNTLSLVTYSSGWNIIRLISKALMYSVIYGKSAVLINSGANILLPMLFTKFPAVVTIATW
jgi:hypothetical protein